MSSIFKLVNSLHRLETDDVDLFLPIYESIMNLSDEELNEANKASILSIYKFIQDIELQEEIELGLKLKVAMTCSLLLKRIFETNRSAISLSVTAKIFESLEFLSRCSLAKVRQSLYEDDAIRPFGAAFIAFSDVLIVLLQSPSGQSFVPLISRYCRCYLNYLLHWDGKVDWASLDRAFELYRFGAQDTEEVLHLTMEKSFSEMLKDETEKAENGIEVDYFKSFFRFLMIAAYPDSIENVDMVVKRALAFRLGKLLEKSLFEEDEENCRRFLCLSFVRTLCDRILKMEVRSEVDTLLRKHEIHHFNGEVPQNFDAENEQLIVQVSSLLKKEGRFNEVSQKCNCFREMTHPKNVLKVLEKCREIMVQRSAQSIPL